MLTTQQLQTLKTDIAASEFAALPNTPDNAFAIAAAYALSASPDFWVWRTYIEKKEVLFATSRNNTTFTFAGNGFIGRSVGELECWNQLFNSILATNPSLPNVRQAFADIFSGAGNAAANRTHLDAVSRRKANRAEKLFATGTGADTANGAATMTFEGTLTYQEVLDARNLV